MNIISITTNLSRYGGAQKVLMDLHNGLKSDYDCEIVGFQDFGKLHPKYAIEADEYKKFSIKVLRNKLIIVHARNVIPLIVLLNKVLFLNSKIIYVSHNVYNTYNLLTFLPEVIVSISKKVTVNLIDYFNVEKKNIHLIYNGIVDHYKSENLERIYKEDDTIRILYPARVNSVKRQLRVVEALKGKLDHNIQIHFAGTGDDFKDLQELCVNSINFIALGFVEDLEYRIVNYDYIMLFSEQEGLPLSLLEGIMCKKPIIANDVGGNLEIGIPGYNGIELIENWDSLAEQLNNLNSIEKNQYDLMSERSRELFLKKFRMEIMVEQYSQLIQTL
ncbi:glycosyltransferase involved in cell wall biosynthesis [Leeuwenhoekiella aestuarii]|uniref:glycosyltransferase family 4 protein n=1 Tax=Leeuwenhoekiella aestuarii TaxID=2249426 RepID=UPI000FFE9A18|nr:glycosyltransferase family 4 protein [Leeuwenhoekiella aestuarii]RXG12921.1 glycosyltransferase involved in cell wall biosynthesis [Leeuwenhoekiella aestuarii]